MKKAFCFIFGLLLIAQTHAHTNDSNSSEKHELKRIIALVLEGVNCISKYDIDSSATEGEGILKTLVAYTQCEELIEAGRKALEKLNQDERDEVIKRVMQETEKKDKN